MAVPKKRRTKSARNQGRNHHALITPTLTQCAVCKSEKRPHHICTVCGTYRTRKYKATTPVKKTSKA